MTCTTALAFRAPPVKVDLSPFVEGDTWNGIQLIGPVTINGDPPAASLAVARLGFKRNYSDFQHAAMVSSQDGEGGPLEIIDADLWTMSVPAQQLPLLAGQYRWDLETVDSDGEVKTYIGGVIEVTPQTTNFD